MSRHVLSLACLLIAGCPDTVATPDTPGGADAPVLDAPRMDAGPTDAPVPEDAPVPMDVVALMDGPSFPLDVSGPRFDAPFPDIRIAAPDVPLGDVSFILPDVPLRLDVGGGTCIFTGCSAGEECCPATGLCYDPGCLACCPIRP